jgi:acyl carrier protein
LSESPSAVEIGCKIRRILVSELDVDPDAVAASTAHTTLLGRGIGLDSMETLKLVAALEQEFGIHIQDSELTAHLFKDLGTLIEFVSRRIADPSRSSGREAGE